MRVMKSIPVASLALILSACSGKSSPTAPIGPPPTTLPARSAISLSFDPDPVIAAPSNNTQFPWSVSFTVIARETAGLACNANLITRTFINPVTNLVSETQQFGVAQIIANAGTNHIPANGTLRMPQNLIYTPGGTTGTGRAVNIRYVLQVIDANGNSINADSTIRALRNGTATPIN